MLSINKITKSLEKLTAKEILNWSLEQFEKENIIVTTSCSLPITIDLLYREIKPSLSIPVVFIDTLHHFSETLETANKIKQNYDVDLQIYQPKGLKSREEFAQIYGEKLWKHDIDRFQFLTKIQPLERALKELEAEVWITGRRRDQSSTRKNLPILEEDPRGYIKINPLANWTYRDVWRYIYQHQVPYNPLHDKGYTSIGDEPLTTPTYSGEEERSGRWRETGRTECGLHLYSASDQGSAGNSTNHNSFSHEKRSSYLTNSNSTQINTFVDTNQEEEEMNKRVIVLGGDGFCGWPTALHLSKHGYEVAIVDNLSRRNIDNELEASSLTPIQPIGVRLQAWQEVSGKTIEFFKLDLRHDYYRLRDLLKQWQPDAVVHFAEQRAAPYSMKSAEHKRYTVDNNVNATHNLLCAIVESGLDIHVVHLGTMGVYGYGTAGMEIPEGYLNVKVNVDGGLQDMRILYPANPGSIYHMTKTLDALIFYYYNKNNGLQITDLHQGIVWGTNTEETKQDPRLINRFDYDGDYGTVLNRFLMQAAAGYPLTVHGKGGQTRAFIHIRNTVQCIKIALENPPEKGDSVEIFNQATETHTVGDLAKKVSGLTGAEMAYLKNPRNEAQQNELRVANDKFVSLGLDIIHLDHQLMEDEIELAKQYVDRCDPSKILCVSKWRDDIEVDSNEDYLGHSTKVYQ